MAAIYWCAWHCSPAGTVTNGSSTLHGEPIHDNLSVAIEPTAKVSGAASVFYYKSA